MINQIEIMMYEMKLSIIQKIWNLIFIITNDAYILVRGNITITGHYHLLNVWQKLMEQQ